MALFTAEGIRDFLGLGDKAPPITLANKPLGWQTRLREAAYTPPSGAKDRMTFMYVDVSREFDLRGTAHEFPQVNDAYVQRTGFGSRRYPLACYFSGSKHDIQATAFEHALMQPGVGKLEHPMYGTLPNVVPFGTVTRNDALATAANQSVVQVTFWTTTGKPYPTAEPQTQNEVAILLEEFKKQAAEQFAKKVAGARAPERAGIIAAIKGYLKTVSGVMSQVSTATASVRREMQDLTDALNFGMDVLIGQPLLLAQQITNLVLAPGRAAAGIVSRLDGYARLAEAIFASVAGNPGKSLATGSVLLSSRNRIAFDFAVADLFALSAVAGSIVAVAGKPKAGDPAPFTTRPQAIAAASAVSELFDVAVSWRDWGFDALSDMPGLSEGQVDTGESYQALQSAAAKTLGFLVQESFGLKAEKRIVLDRDRTVIDLCAELYKTVDEKLDLLITSNDLTGDEILELPKGKSIVYYP
jgi:DNA circularisation protein N-terminus